MQLHQLPHLMFLIAWQPVSGFSSNLEHVCSRTEKFSEYDIKTFRPEKSHDQKRDFKRGVHVR